MEKTDLKKTYKIAYTGKKDPQIVKIPPMKYLSFQGKGSPDSQLFQEAMAVLYGLAYTIKFMFKKRGQDFIVAPVEAQWWSDDPASFTENRKDAWIWKAMICVPDAVTPADLDSAVVELGKKKNLPELDLAALETIEDGESVQVLYIGAYAEESATIALMHHFIKEHGYELRGHHREVYLSDMRRTAPEKLKTIIRQPIEKLNKG